MGMINGYSPKPTFEDTDKFVLQQAGPYGSVLHILGATIKAWVNAAITAAINAVTATINSHIAGYVGYDSGYQAYYRYVKLNGVSAQMYTKCFSGEIMSTSQSVSHGCSSAARIWMVKGSVLSPDGTYAYFGEMDLEYRSGYGFRVLAGATSVTIQVGSNYVGGRYRLEIDFTFQIT